jgi:molybdopterin-guanine dinucleotide biosynthesis protein A
MNITTEFSVIILAGGASERMGFDKRKLTLGDRSLAQHTLALAEKLSDDIVVSSNEQIAEFDGSLVIPDRMPGEGPVGGLISSLPHIQYPNAIVLTIDMPLVTPELVYRLLDQHRANEITYFSVKKYMQPFPAIYPSGLTEMIAEALAKNIKSLKGLLTRLPSRSVPVIADHEHTLFLNINHRDDLEKARAMYPDKA